MDKTQLIKSIEENEGLRLKPYLCPAKTLTIGYGRNIEDKGISKSEAMLLLENDLNEINNQLLAEYEFYQLLDNPRKNVLIEMVYNMGFPRFKGFKSMLKYLEKNDFYNASVEMLDSKWHRDFQTYAPHTKTENLRSSKLSKIMKEGKYA